MAFFIFLIGLFIGSFLNVLADRLPREESPFKGRSHCDNCRKELGWLDLIPLLSFVLLKGKCRHCKAKLSWYYPITELITGILFAITYLFVFSNFKFLIFNFYSIFNSQFLNLATNYQLLITLVYYLFIVSSLIVVFFADLKYGIIPDKIVFPAILVSFLYLILNTQYSIFPYFLSAIGASLFFFLLFLLTKGKGMGLGDVKFAFLMGLISGFPNTITSLYLAFLTGAIVGVILILWGKKKLKGSTIPFGPFLVFGTFTALFWGEKLLNWGIRLLSY